MESAPDLVNDFATNIELDTNAWLRFCIVPCYRRRFDVGWHEAPGFGEERMRIVEAVCSRFQWVFVSSIVVIIAACSSR